MPSSPIRRVAANGMRALQGEAGAALFNAAAMSIIAQSAGVSQFGTFALYLSYSELMGRLFFPQCWEALTRFAGAEQSSFGTRMPGIYRTCFALDVMGSALGTVSCLIGLSVFERISGIDNPPGATGLLLCLLPLGWAADSTIGVLRLLDRFDLYSKAQWATGIIKLSLVAMAAVFVPGLTAMAAAFVLSAFVGAGLKLHYAHRAMRKAGLSVSGSGIGLREARRLGLLAFVWNQHVNVSLRAIAVRLDVLVMGYFAPAAAVGAYRAAAYIGSLVSSAAVPLFAAYYPEAVRLVGLDDKASLMRLTFFSCAAALSIGIVSFLAFAVAGEWLVLIVFGEGFEMTYPLGVIYLGATALALMATPLYSLTLALGAAHAALRSQAIAATGFSAVLVIATHIGGAQGAAASQYAYYGLWLVSTLLFLSRSLTRK